MKLPDKNTRKPISAGALEFATLTTLFIRLWIDSIGIAFCLYFSISFLWLDLVPGLSVIEIQFVVSGDEVEAGQFANSN